MFAEFKTLPQLFDFFKDEKTCLTYWENIRWGNTGIVCSHCNAANPYKTNRGYKCRNIECQKKFTALTGSIFENTKLPLRIWFGAMYLCASHKKGVSSLQIGRDLGIHQSSAWFLLHRIRETMSEQDPTILGGEGIIVETDSTYVGGKVKNMRKSKRKDNSARGKRIKDNKTAITAYIERGGNIRFDVRSKGEVEKELIIKNIDRDSFLMTDDSNVYNEMGDQFAGHETVNHTKGEYVRGKAHTNTIEGAFSHFDRMVIGTYHSISPKHMQAYANESAYRYNTRKITDPVRFEETVLKCSGVRLTYNSLVRK